MKDDVNLIPGAIQYSGPTSLVELSVTKVNLISKGSNHLSVVIELRRKCFFHIVTTYFPTLCLLIIVEVLLFMPEGHFETTITVSLTTMLVMYTLYQSILDTLPQTSYLKLIDIWLIACLTLPFLVFLVEVVSQISKSIHGNRRLRFENKGPVKDDQSNVTATNKIDFKDEQVLKQQAIDSHEDEQMNNTEKKQDAWNKKTTAKSFFLGNQRIIIPIASLFFIIIYAIFALSCYLKN